MNFTDHYLIGVTNAGLTSSKRQLFVVDMESGESQISEPVKKSKRITKKILS